VSRGLRSVARQYLWVVTTIAIFVIAAVATAAYILDHQRFRWPWDEVMSIEVEFPSGQAITAGQGQQVLVSGVKVGEIGGVKLDGGRALVTLDIEPDRAGPLYRDASFLVRPKTALNDMSVQVDPGRPNRSLPGNGRLHDGDRVGEANTQVNVNADEVLSALDADSRRYFTILAAVASRSLKGKGARLRAVLRAGQPTFGRLARITHAVGARRRELRRLVHNLRLLSHSAAAKDKELAGLVDSSSATFRALGEREADLSTTVERLPGALHATRGALADARRLSVEARPALAALRPAVRELPSSLTAARPLLREATPVLHRQVTPLVREVTPLLRELHPPLQDLRKTTPGLTRTGHVLNYLVNGLAYNPPGSEEGYLFWLSWFAHNADSLFSVEDSHGAVWRGLATGSCSSLEGVATLALPPALATAISDALPLCP
jgi:phospholipid/cholesterol/gamma-HCH transport system substrate-binding protein